MENKSRRRIHIACYDTDEACLLKPASFMDYAQELAGDNAAMLGFGYDDLMRENLVWVIARMKMEFIRMPKWRDDVELLTWHRGFDGPFQVRDYRLFDADGSVLANATSSWVIVDLHKRKIVKTAFGTNPETICQDAAIEQTCRRLRIPRGMAMDTALTHTVAYSDIDRNRHANNAMYVVWAMDALDRHFLAEHQVRSLEVDYVAEAMPGEEVTIKKSNVTDGVCYVAGYVGEKESFVAKFTF